MIGFPLALVYANAAEWLIHKHVLHGLGKKKSSFWNFHWGEHHGNCRKHAMGDPDYERSPLSWNAQGKEMAAVVGLMAAHAPLAGVAPWFTAGVWYSGLNYLYKHRRSHLDPAWAKQHLRHHYDHHMGRQQDANWGVTRPWADWLMGTRVHYAYDEKTGRAVESKPRTEAPTERPAAAQPGLARTSDNDQRGDSGQNAA